MNLDHDSLRTHDLPRLLLFRKTVDGNVVEVSHQLTTVANTKREGVLAVVEAIELLLELRVVENSTGPTLGRLQDILHGEHTPKAHTA